MPVGRWVIRTAEDVLLTCWPPLPEARNVSIRKSSSLISISMSSSTTGYTNTDAKERSEEHTSELQSRLHLVCRLLLEKKKKHHIRTQVHLSTKPGEG